MIVSTDAFISSRSQTPTVSGADLYHTLKCADNLTTPSFAKEIGWSTFCRFNDELNEAIAGAHEDATAGRGNKILDPRSISRAENLLGTLPVGFPYPEPSIRENGDLLLEWLSGVDISLAVSIPGTGRIQFAMYLKGEKAYGTFDFVGDELAASFVTAAKRWWRTSSRQSSS